MSRKLKAVLSVVGGGVLVFAVVFATIFALPGKAEAVSNSSVMQKALVNYMRSCYRNDHLKSPLDEGTIGTRFQFSALVDNVGSFVLPTDIDNSLGTNTITCLDVFEGKGSNMKSVYGFFGKSRPTLEEMGYTNVAGESGESGYQCISLKYYVRESNNSGRYYNTNKLCIPVENGKLVMTNAATDIRGEVTNDMYINSDNTKKTGTITLWVTYEGRIVAEIYDASGALNTPNDTTLAGGLTNGADWTTIKNQIASAAPGLSASYKHSDNGNIYSTSQNTSTSSISVETESSTGTLTSSMGLDNNSALVALRALTGNSSDTYENYEFVDEDWYFIYRTYIDRLLLDNKISINADCTPENKSKSNVMTYDGVNWCEVMDADQVSGQFGGRQFKASLKLMSFTQILADMKLLNFSNVASDLLTGTPGDSVNGGDNNPGENAGAETPNCFNSAGSLGWILCPVLEGLSAVVDGIYDKVIAAQFLEIEASFMAADSSGSVYQGWQDFRNFANIIFAILFIVVILAQVTGIGIDNYNVKKILPRLIMTVVLVNISFILCQLVVDLSNILGFSLKKMFTDMAGDTVVTVGGFVGNLGAALTSTAVTGIVIAGAVGAAVITWEFWLFPLLLFLLGVIISIFFFAIILGVRKAGILILIVLAPVAIVCYTLPNTKKFFDRWFKMFSSLLLVYPICGLLMGGGQYASTLLLGAAGGDDVGFFMALVAMLVQVVPFFFIPSLVRGSLAAMGNLGMKISNFGERFSGGLQRGIRNSEGMKEAQRSLSMRNAERTFNRLNRRIERRSARGADVSDSLMRRRSNAAARYNRMAYEDIRAGGTQELLSQGSARRTLAEQGVRTQQMREDVSAQEGLYKNDPAMADEQIMGNAYEDALNDLMADPTDRAAEVRVQALQNLLSETDAGRSQVQSRMMSVLDHTMQTNPGLLTNGQTSGLSVAAAHLNQQHMATYKAKNRGMFSLIGDLTRQQYDLGTQEMRDAQGHVITDPSTGQAQRHRFERIVQRDASGNAIQDSQGRDMFRYRSTHYDRSGLASYTAETLAGADEGTIDRIMESIGSGMVSGNDLQSIATTASEALNSDTVRVQPKIAQKLRQIERSGYAASPSTFARATDASLGDIASRIQSGEINDANGSTELTRLALSAQSALRDPAALHSPETAERLNQILTAAGAQGAVDTATGTHFRAVDAASIKIRGRETPRTRQTVPVPHGWTENGIWVGGGSGPTKRQQIAYEQWARHAADVEIHNAQINNPPPPPPTPSP